MKSIPISEWIWNSKYRHLQEGADAENDISDTWCRVARAVASAEPDPDRWQAEFNAILSELRFLPGGRVIAGAGTGKQVTLFNCFVAGPIRDSIKDILDSLKETAVTMQQGGGIGCDFSNLRPSGAAAKRTGSVASGPLPFMHIWDSLCETLLATSTRRGAMMGTLRCDHPDIETFITAKREQEALNNFNLSVLITDDFMRAMVDDAEWQLVYPAKGTGDRGIQLETASKVYRSLPARELWQQIVRAAHETAEPGMLFVDNINRNNNLYYCESISATNPCGEIPLPPYGACNLGSVNLTALVSAPFTEKAEFEWKKLRDTVSVAVRFLDDVIDVSQFPLEEQARQARNTRRIGIGITGLADMLAMLGLHYDSNGGRAFARDIMKSIRDAAYDASVELARDRAPFPFFEKNEYLKAPFIRQLPEHLQAGIAKHGIRNSHLLAIAPAGTISLLAGNVSSGVEPIYALEATRQVRDRALNMQRLKVRDYAYELWQASAGKKDSLPKALVTADMLPASAHLAMQACLQPYVDNAISKTVNLAPEATLDDVDAIFSDAYSSGLKGCTVFRPGARWGQVLRSRDDSHCCHADREAD
jgi:ribonucleoside-diphosphate reductase alpha chain